MKQWVTEIKAISPANGEIAVYGGPNVPGLTMTHAQSYCENNGLAYCIVIGQLVTEVPVLPNTMSPDWSNRIDYDNLN
jgi:hypothetical protein